MSNTSQAHCPLAMQLAGNPRLTLPEAACAVGAIRITQEYLPVQRIRRQSRSLLPLGTRGACEADPTKMLGQPFIADGSGIQNITK